MAQDAPPADLKESIDALSQKLGALNDAQKSAVRKDPNLPSSIDALATQIYAIQSATDAERVEAVAKKLKGLLSDGRFNNKERQTLPTGTEIKALTADLNELAGQIHVHVIKATYGDHRTRRICDATAYFRANCLNQSKCPADVSSGISGAAICGYEPAPLAKDGANAARVHYTCGQSEVRQLLLRGKTQILCAP